MDINHLSENSFHSLACIFEKFSKQIFKKKMKKARLKNIHSNDNANEIDDDEHLETSRKNSAQKQEENKEFIIGKNKIFYKKP